MTLLKLFFDGNYSKVRMEESGLPNVNTEFQLAVSQNNCGYFVLPYVFKLRVIPKQIEVKECKRCISLFKKHTYLH